jgi:hypothetical protein
LMFICRLRMAKSFDYPVYGTGQRTPFTAFAVEPKAASATKA